MAGRYAHARQFKRMRREVKKLKTYLGRVFRDLCRKIAGKAELEARFARLLGLVEHLLAQEPKSKNKLYSLQAPEVACIAKGKERTPYEFCCYALPFGWLQSGYCNHQSGRPGAGCQTF